MPADGWKKMAQEHGLDTVAVARPPSVRSLMEQYIGRHSAHLRHYRDNAPKPVYREIKNWNDTCFNDMRMQAERIVRGFKR